MASHQEEFGLPEKEEDFQIDEASVFQALGGGDEGEEGEANAPCEACDAQVGDPDAGVPEGDAAQEIPIKCGRDIWCRLAHATNWGHLPWKELEV